MKNSKHNYLLGLRLASLIVLWVVPAQAQCPELISNFPQEPISNELVSQADTSDSYWSQWAPQVLQDLAATIVTDIKSVPSYVASLPRQAQELVEAVIQLNEQLAASTGVPEEYQRAVALTLLAAEVIGSSYGLYQLAPFIKSIFAPSSLASAATNVMEPARKILTNISIPGNWTITQPLQQYENIIELINQVSPKWLQQQGLTLRDLAQRVIEEAAEGRKMWWSYAAPEQGFGTALIPTFSTASPYG